MKKILILCVDYNSAIDTIGFINSVLNMHSVIEVVLILNSGKTNFPENFFNKKRLHVYDYGSNLGYMQAASEGLKSYLKSNELPDWIILSNTDISFPDKNFFDRLSEDTRQEFIIAPDIVSYDGAHQNPFLKKRLARKKLFFLTKVNSCSLVSALYNLLAKIKIRCKMIKGIKTPESSFIYAPHGSFIIIGSHYFTSGETLDHPAFLYGEELLIAERALRSGISTFYDSSYQVIHAEHVATGKMSNSFRAKSLRDSLNSIIRDFY